MIIRKGQAVQLHMPIPAGVVGHDPGYRSINDYDPALANKDPMGNGWFFKVHVTHMEQFDELMDPPAYDKLLKTL